MKFLLIYLGFFILLLIIVFIIQSIKIRKLSENPKNNVHFYVVRDKSNNLLYLYLGKPRRDTNKFYSSNKGCIVEREEFLYNFKLNTKDFENLKFEDEPVEVFLNLGN